LEVILKAEKSVVVDPLIRIVLVEDLRLFRDLIRVYLESVVGFSVVAEADNGGDGVNFVKLHRPHVCVMDITLKGLDGFEATKKIIADCGKTRVLAISASSKPDYVRRMIEAGAFGYICKDCPPSMFCEAVRSVAAGIRFFPTVAKEKHNTDAKKPLLSKREVQLIRLLSNNCTMPEIADELNLSYSTVNVYKVRAMMKTGTHTTTELVKYAIKNGIVNLD
jgi:DNA-binding NarL/FixJ family response regulator